MAGKADLTELIRTMRPRLRPEIFVFVALPAGGVVPPEVDVIMSFAEAEATTLIVEREAAAAAGLAAVFTARMITLEVHSDLAAVGFLAAIASRLAAAGIATNAVSAVHHDHLFVPADRADEALAALASMSDAAA